MQPVEGAAATKKAATGTTAAEAEAETRLLAAMAAPMEAEAEAEQKNPAAPGRPALSPAALPHLLRAAVPGWRETERFLRPVPVPVALVLTQLPRTMILWATVRRVPVIILVPAEAEAAAMAATAETADVLSVPATATGAEAAAVSVETEETVPNPTEEEAAAMAVPAGMRTNPTQAEAAAMVPAVLVGLLVVTAVSLPADAADPTLHPAGMV